MSIEVTVIIPSYNRYPLNLLTLHSLENQTFDLSKMEVILIDDASTDETVKLKDYVAPFHFRYMKNNENLGRSKTRNLGIKNAKGKILIFLDAEVIVGPNFVKSHYHHHLVQKRVVVIGRYSNRVYSFLYPEYNKLQKKEFCKIVKNTPISKDWVKQRVNSQIKFKKCSKIFKKINEPIQLISTEDIDSFSPIKLLSLPIKYSEEIIDLMNDNFPLPWLGCITLNLSIRKDLIKSVGGYDEDFKGWGLEDYDIGFRLYKTGVKFFFDPKIFIYHQEHPIKKAIIKEYAQNMIRFQQKHPVIDIYILSLNHVKIRDRIKLMSEIVAEYQSLSQIHPNEFDYFKKGIIAWLRQIPYLRAKGRRVTNILSTSGIPNNEEEKKRLFSERDLLEKYGFSHLVHLFDVLVRL